MHTAMTDVPRTTTDPEAPGREDPWRRGFTRRRLLRGGAALGCAALSSQLLTTRYAFAQTPAAADADTLVVLTFRGGIDGLSVAVPRDEAYRAARPGVAVPESATTRLDDRFGLHPALAPLAPLYERGVLGLVHAVGSPVPNYSHFDAMDVVERGAIAQVGSGWLDRVVAERNRDGDPERFAAVAISDNPPRTLLGDGVQALAMRSFDDFALPGDDERLRVALRDVHAGRAHPATAAMDATLDAQQRLAELVTTGGDGYPDTRLAAALREVAILVKADVGLQVATCDIGGWDMHTDMGVVDRGDMTDHLAEVAGALAAFAADLGDAGLRRTTLVTQSEFGRRLAQNDSGGTDHGHGNVLLALGGSVRGGQVHGTWPGLADDALVHGNLAVTTDTRDVLGEWLTKRGGVGDLSAVFPDLAHEPIGLFRR